MQVVSSGATANIERKTPLLADWFLEHGAMIEAHNQICVNLRLSAVRVLCFL
jgi:hypothetical protein